MRARTIITVVRICLAFIGIFALAGPIREIGNSAASHEGAMWAHAAIALFCFVAAIPWGRPARTAGEKDEEL